MHLYFAGYSGAPQLFKQCPEATHLLEAYPFFQKIDYKLWHEKKELNTKALFLDSGAFSAFTRKVVISVEDYAAYLQKYKSLITVYANLDVIGDAAATDRNQAYLESKGLSPLPTFHYGSDLIRLEQLCKTYSYVALGGIVPHYKKRLLLADWFNRCFSITIPAKVKVHGYGVGAFWAWKRYPFYSVDATSWQSGGRFRKVIRFYASEGELHGTNKVSRTRNILDFMLVHKGHHEYLDKINMQEFIKAADFCTRLWAKRGISWGLN